MKKLKTLFLCALTFMACNSESLDNDPIEQSCDTGTFVGDVRLTTQEEVNTFGENCYTKIEGTLYIGPNSLDDDQSNITDLTPFINLTEIFTDDVEQYAKLWIGNNPLLTNLQGLNSLTKADALLIRVNPLLANIDGLENLTKLNGNGTLQHLWIVSNESLQDLNGLENLRIIGSEENSENVFTQIAIYENNSLLNLDGLSG